MSAEVSPAAGALQCPNCGAPAAPDEHRCGYCGSRLATVACPSCLERMFEEAAFCPHCGAARSRTERAASKPCICGRCRDRMREVTVDPATFFECPTCDSLWMEAAVFERFCADRELQAAVLHKQAGRAERRLPLNVRYRACPTCGKLMNRVNFSKYSGIILDVCRGHGTFLDPGEIARIAAFIHGGGIDRTRERDRESLIEEQRRLEALQSRPTLRLSHDVSAGDSPAVSLSEFLDALFDR